MSIAWGDVPTWIQGVGVVATLGYAARQLGNQGKQLKVMRRQLDVQQKFNEKQSKILDLQAGELRADRAEREREAHERRRAQAAQVFITCDYSSVIGGDTSTSVQYTVRISNTSAQPVYQVRVLWHAGTSPWCDGGRETDELKRLMPGDGESYIRDWTAGGNLTTIGAALEFHDAAGVRWHRTDGGDLEELHPRQ